MTTMTEVLHAIGYAAGFAGAVLIYLSYRKRSMLDLHRHAVLGCGCLIVYGALTQAWPSLGLYLLLLPLNWKKMRHIEHALHSMKNANAQTPVEDWLLVHMTPRQEKAGTVLWRAGDTATELLFLASGALRKVEFGENVRPGELVGEIGLFSPDKRRTLTLQCVEDCELYSLSEKQLADLYFYKPELGFLVMKTIVGRLMHDVQLARQGSAAPVSA